MSNCNTRNCCFQGIDLVVKCYDPQPEFTDFKIPTWWFNVCTGKLYLLKGIDDDGKAIWIEITAGGAGGDGIQKILTQCGVVDADDSGQITHSGECGARVVAADCKDLCITVNTDWGLQGGKNVCAGESINLSIDKENTNLVTSSSNNVKDGDSVVFDGTSGKIIKRAMNWRVGDGTDSWTGRFNPDDKSFQIFPNEMSDKPIIQMLSNGVILSPWQPKCTAKLSQRVPNFPVAQDYEIGSTRAFTKLRDTDGYNQNANNFFPGDGNGNAAYYTCPYTGVYNIGWQFVADRTTVTDTVVRIKVKLFFGSTSNEQSLLYNYLFGPDSYQTVSDYISLALNKEDRIRWTININKGTPYINVMSRGNEIDNFIGILFVG